MKIKAGFVTNSSSTSYVVMIPSDLNIDDFMDIIGEYGDWYEDEDETINQEAYIKDVKNAIEQLKNGATLYEEHDDDMNGDVMNAIVELSEKLGLMITGMDSASSDGKIIGVGPENISNMFSNWEKKKDEIKSRLRDK